MAKKNSQDMTNLDENKLSGHGRRKYLDDTGISRFIGVVTHISLV